MKSFATCTRLLFLLAACGACSDGAGPEPADQDPIVSMPGFSFTPFSTTINAGGRVVFEFPFEPHNVIFSPVSGAPANIQATSNASVSRTFPVAGTFPFDCVLHPGMSGQVVVR